MTAPELFLETLLAGDSSGASRTTARETLLRVTRSLGAHHDHRCARRLISTCPVMAGYLVNPSQSIVTVGVNIERAGTLSCSALTTPTRVSPAAAAEQKQHQENDQYGLHVYTSIVRKSGSGLWNGRLISSVHCMLELTKTEV